MWSDECSAERGKGGAQTWVFRTVKDNKWDSKFVEIYKKGKDLVAIVWGCFWVINGQVHRLDLYIMDRDFESKKHEYSANFYLEVLED